MFLNDLVGWLNTFLTGYVSNVVGYLVAALAGIATLMTTIYVLNYGFAVLRNEVSEPLDVFAVKAMKMSMIIAASVGSSFYMGHVHSGFDSMQNGMATVFLSGGAGMAQATNTGTAYSALDLAYDKADERLMAIRAEADPVNDFDLIVADVVFTFGMWIFLIVAAGVTLMSKVFLAFGLTVGPIAILCLMFQRTSNFFTSWLGFCLSAVVMTWFAFFALGLGLFVLDQIASQLVSAGAYDPDASVTAVSPLKGAGAFLCMCVLMAVMLWQAPKLAASLTGGAAMTSGMAAVGGFIAGRMSGGRNSGGAGGSGGSGGDNSVNRGGGASYASGQATGYAFQRVSSLMRGRR